MPLQFIYSLRSSHASALAPQSSPGDRRKSRAVSERDDRAARVCSLVTL